MLSSTKSPITFPGQERTNTYLSFASEVVASREIIELVNKELGMPFSKLNVIVVTGLQDVSITVEYLHRLFLAEARTVGSLCYQNFLDLTQSIKVNGTSIALNDFNKYAYLVKSVCEKLGCSLHSKQIMAFIAALYFIDLNVKVALYEVGFESDCDPVYLDHVKIVAIPCLPNKFDDQECEKYTVGVTAGTHVITAEQARICISKLKERVAEKGGIWQMPIRKFPVTKYIFHNLYAHAMGLAERVGVLFCGMYGQKEVTFTEQNSFFVKKEAIRGRPRIEHKRNLESKPEPSLEQFWLNTDPGVLAHSELKSLKNNDYLIHRVKNVYDIIKALSAAKLLHYQNNYSSIIVGIKLPAVVTNEELDVLFKELRYFSKKMSMSSIAWLSQASRIQPLEMMYQIPVVGIFKVDELKAYSEEKLQGSLRKLIIFAGDDEVVKDIYSYNL